VLGDIPVLGWLFKNRTKTLIKENLLILISAQILEPHSEKDVRRFTQKHINEYHGTLDQMSDVGDRRDPVHKMFFKDTNQPVDDFIFERKQRESTQANMKVASRRQRKRRKKTDVPHETVLASADRQKKVPAVPAVPPVPVHAPVAVAAAAPLEKSPVSLPQLGQDDILNKKIRKRKRTSLSVASLLDADKKASA